MGLANDMRNNLLGGAVAMATMSVDSSVRLILDGIISYELALVHLLEEYSEHSPKHGDMDAELRLTLEAPISAVFPPAEVGELVLWPSCPVR